MASAPYTLYLFRDGLGLSKQRLRNRTAYQPVAIVEPVDDDVHWELYVRQNPPSPVTWLERLQTIMANPGNVQVQSQSAGAVLLIAAHGRVWAVTFGTGYHAIDPSEYEQDFGLRVTANTVDPYQVTLAETRGLDKGTRNAVSMLPLPSQIFALRVSTNEEWVRRFGGRILDPDFGISAAGADSLRLNLAEFELARLPGKLAEVLAAFLAEGYKQTFPFLDYFRKLPRRHPLIAVLDDQLDRLLQARSTDVGLAGPDDLQQHPDGYEVHYQRRSVPVRELTAGSIYDALDELDAWHRPRELVQVVPRGGDAPDAEHYVLGRYLVANLHADDGVDSEFALTAGSWFKIDQSYAERIERFMGTVEDITDELGLPDWDDEWLQANVDGKYAEQRYNRFVSGERGYRLLDREMYRGPTHTGQRVEVCDLMTNKKELICVKRLDGAESMVHLFEQGALSAGMMRDEAYRQRVMRDLQACGGDVHFGGNSDWTFVFAIATSRRQPLHDLFTFFAKVALNNNATAIMDRGFRVKIAKIVRTT